MPSCYYYDEQRNRCNCYVNENLNELLSENAKLRELCVQMVETVECSSSTKRCVLFSECAAGEFEPCLYEQKLRELRIEVDG